MRPKNEWQHWKPAKKRRIHQGDELIAGIKLSDINYDCLEAVFEKLEISDLLNLADTSKTLRILIQSRLPGKFNRLECIKIEKVRPSRNPLILFDGKSCRITDAKSSVRFLRCFGHLIRAICIDYEAGFGFLYTKIYQYLNEYCCDNLKRLQIDSAPAFAINHVLDKPFPKVKHAILEYVTLGDTFSHFNQLFPNIKSLKLTNVRMNDTKCIEQQFPKLVCLVLKKCVNEENSRNERRLLLRESNFAVILRLNPNIRKLVFDDFIFDGIFHRYMSENLQGIKKLTVTSDLTNLRLRDDVIRFENVESFYLYAFTEKVKRLPKIPFLFSKLKKFELGLDAAYLDKKFIYFLQMHPLLVKLKIYSKNPQFSQRVGDIQKLVKVLPSLNKLYIMDQGFSFDEIITLIKECKTLKDVILGRDIFNSDCDSKIDRMLMEQIGEQWRIIDFDKKNITLQRFLF